MGLFKKKKVTIGFRYYIGAHLLLARGPVDFIYQLWLAKRIVKVGFFQHGQLNIDRQGLFGGKEREGGVSGKMDLEFGGDTQIVNDYLEARQGTGVTPAYRGVLAAVIRRMYIGMSPYLKPWSFRIQRIFIKGRNGEDQWYKDKAGITMYGDLNDFNIFTLISTVHGGPTPGNGILFTGLNAKTTYYLTMSATEGTGGWSPWAKPSPANCADPNISNRSGSRNTIWVAPDGSASNEFSISSDECHDGYEAARVAFPNGEMRGYTSYEIYIKDDPINDNSGSMVFILGPEIPGEDMNPIHMIREAITDTEWGMGFGDADIGTTFAEAADVLFLEKFGLSTAWARQAEVGEFIDEILSTIDAYVYVDNATGLWEINLIRDDYDLGSLPVIGEDAVIKVGNTVSRVDPSEAINSVTVDYLHYKTGDSASISIQDQTLVSEIGSIRGTKINFKMVRWEKLASRIALRELIKLSSSVLNGSITIDRTIAELNPGDPFILHLPRLQIFNEVMRAANISYSKNNEEQIDIEFITDIFSIKALPLINSRGSITSEWRSNPEIITRRRVVEASYWTLAQALGDIDAQDQTSNSPLICFLDISAESPTDDAMTATVIVNEGAGYEEVGVIDFAPVATLTSALGIDAGADTSFTVNEEVDLDDVLVGSLATIGGIEIVTVVSIIGLTITVGRGCLDTTIVAHTIGEFILFWSSELQEFNETEYSNAASVDVKLLTLTALGQLEEIDAPADTVVFNQRAIRPLPIGKFQLDAEYVPSADLDDTAEVLTWAHRDRLTQTDETVDDFTAGDIGPEAGVDYQVIITWRDAAGIQVGADVINTSVGTALTYTLALGYLAGRPNTTEIELWFQVETTRSGFTGWTLPTIKGVLP